MGAETLIRSLHGMILKFSAFPKHPIQRALDLRCGGGFENRFDESVVLLLALVVFGMQNVVSGHAGISLISILRPACMFRMA